MPVSNLPVSHLPAGYHAVTPYLVVDNAAAALAFYARAFGAQEVFRLPMDGKIGHAEFRIGDSTLMLSDEWPDMGALGPTSRGGSTTGFVVYVPDADAAFAQAVQAGARAECPVADRPWGDRMGSVVDPFGHKWSLATHVEDVSADELQRRMSGSLQLEA